MKTFSRTTWSLCKGCTYCLCSFVLWSVWLLLAVVLAFQLKVAFSRELTLPAWLVHRLENKHAARGIVAHFGAATIDPHGRVLLRDVSIRHARYPDPLLTARSIEFSLDPWAALTRDFAASEIHLRGVNLHLPPVLSPSGHNEAVLTDLNLSLRNDHPRLVITYLNARYAGLVIAARGDVAVPRAAEAARRPPGEIVDQVLKTYLQAARQLAARAPAIAWFEAPRLDLVLTAHPTRVATARAKFTAASARLPGSLLRVQSPPESIELGALTASATVPLVSDQPWATRIQLSATNASAPGRFSARDLALSALLDLQPGWKAAPRSVELQLSRLDAFDLSAAPVSARLTGTYPTLRAEAAAGLLGETWSAAADLDLSSKSGYVRAASRLSPELLALASRRARRDLAAIIQPSAPPAFALEAVFSPGWKLASADGRFSSGPATIRRVAIERASADFSFAGSRLDASHIVLKTRQSEARGSYTMDTRSNVFRFLLDGALRPADIDGWLGAWWPRFWSHFDFSQSTPPRADIEIAGRWGRPMETIVFLHAAADHPVIRTVPFDHVRTTLFIRPHFYNGLELVATRGAGGARGTFARTVDLAKNALVENSFDIAADLDVRESARIFGAVGTGIVEPFVFERPPALAVTGRITGPASPEGEHQHARIKIDSVGPFTFFDFPLSNLTTEAVLHDDDLVLENIRVGFARGYVTGRARMNGKNENRRLGFDATLEKGSLGEAIQTLEAFGARRKKLPPPPRSKFQERVADGLLGLRVSGDGNYQDIYSFIGSGSGEITGAELAQINLLGGLSEVLRAVRLNFTSLRLNAAQANFKLQGRQLDFSELRITGPTAVIDLTGLYRLDLQQMDFNARVSPFELSRNPLASAVDLVLTPFTTILELKLSGSLDRPRWRFAYGPSSLLRSLSGKNNFNEKDPAPAPARERSSLPPPSLRRR